MPRINIGDGVLILLNRHADDDKKRRDAGADWVVYIDVGREFRWNMIGRNTTLDSDCPIEGSCGPISH